MKAVKWSQEKIRKVLSVRLSDAKKYRKHKFESKWRENEQTIYNGLGMMDSDLGGGNVSIDQLSSYLENSQEVDPGIGVNYAFKHYRYIHSQMSANPPSVLARPTSSDPADKRRADGSDKLCRHGIRAYKMQETTDKATSKTLLYGTGWIKTLWDKFKGDITEFNKETGEVIMEGDLDISSPSTWDVWVDPHARDWDKVKFIFERVWMCEEEAVSHFPEAAELIESIIQSLEDESRRYADDARSDLEEKKIPIYYYWEKGLPTNGMAGRMIPCLEDGTPLAEDGPSPFRFPKPPEDAEELRKILEAEKAGIDYDRGPEIAYFPFHILTDIDVADQVYGKSFVEYEVPIQDTLNRLDSVTLDNVQSHGVVRMVLPEGCEVAGDQPTNTPYEIIKTTGSQKPSYVSVPTIMPDATALRDRLQAGGDDVAGVNDSMFGKQEREQSGFSMQYATNQGNMIRRRLFNKYVMFVESVYKSYLSLIQKHWKTDRTIKVLGREKAYESIDIKGSDILGGFDLVVEYGASLSLDPTSRREEIMALMPIFEKGGVDIKNILSMLKLNELEGMYDLVELGETRQQEIFEHIIENKGKVYIAPREMQDHESMLAYCYKFVMTSEYRDLDKVTRAVIDKHIKDREALAAGNVEQPPLGASTVPGPMGEPGPLPEGGGLAGSPMEGELGAAPIV